MAHISTRPAGALLLGALATGTLAAAALSPPGVAHATCASISGIKAGSGNCTTTAGNIAVALGSTSSATATGGTGNVAIAVGDGSVTEQG
jgi:hypothetical protein